jgi:hypothetical protein
MLRSLRPTLAALSLVAGLASLTPAILSPQPAVAQGASGVAAAPALSVEEARAAATRILETIKRGDANARFAQFAPERQAITSPSMIAATMRSQPKLLSYELLSVRSGLNSSTVEAEIRTAAGDRVVFMVLNPEGKITRYYIDRTDDDTSKVARQFVEAVSTGNFITANSFLSPDFQKEIPPEALQRKWLGLQRITGNFVRVGRAVESGESTPDTRLVLVNVEFNRLTDNLFVILNGSNQITGVDFPEEPAQPQPVR